MNVSKRVISMFLCLGVLAWVVFVSFTGSMEPIEEEVVDKDSLVIWYTDENLSDYINSACVSFNELYDVRVVPKLQSGDEYLEQINSASIKDEGTPDLYVISNDSLERAYLGGLATLVTEDADIFNDEFPTAAKQAVSYKGNKIAYPFYFETSVLIYNRTYLYEMAENKLLSDESAEPENGEENAADVVADDEAGLTKEEKIENRIQESIPETFEELLEFANTADAPLKVESIFKWDVKDIFYNYFFVGNYMDIGGENGDDTSIINIYNKNAIDALSVYQDMNQFFSFDYENITYDSVIQEFIEGKLVFTTATSDVIMRLEEAREEGTFEYEYGVASIPDLNDELTSKSMSVTSTVVVNGFSDKKELANAFAKYMTVTKADELYEITGKLSACKNVQYDETKFDIFFEEYSESAPLPKMMATSNFWLLAESTFENIWAGKSINSEVKKLSEQVKEQVTGVVVSEEYIDIPDSLEEIEYLDEDAEREAAQQDGDETEENGNSDESQNDGE